MFIKSFGTGSVYKFRFAVQHSDSLLRGIEVVETFFLNLRGRAVHYYGQIGPFDYLVDLEHSPAVLQGAAEASKTTRAFQLVFVCSCIFLFSCLFDVRTAHCVAVDRLAIPSALFPVR